MSARLGIAIGTLVALGLPISVFGQDAPPLQRPPEAVEASLSGSLLLEPFARDGAIERLRSALNGLPGADTSETLVLVDAALRLDFRYRDLVRAVAEIGNLPYEGGSVTVLGGDAPDPVIRKLFADVPVIQEVEVRAGLFDYAWRVRPHDEPFFLDVGRTESFHSGLTDLATSATVRPTADRDIDRAGGALAKVRAGDFVQIELAVLNLHPPRDGLRSEIVSAALVNFPLSERSAFFAGGVHVAGADGGVWTLGFGGNGYFGPERELEMFGEAYTQGGSIGRGIDKRAWAGQAGARWFGGSVWAELSAAIRSGDRDPFDDRDQTFQSYEGQSRFLIAEDPAVGLDWDTNLVAVRAAASYAFGAACAARLDVGWFRVPEDVIGPSGTRLAPDGDLGWEIDASIRSDVSSQFAAWLRVAALAGSDVLEDLDPERSNSAWAAAAGASIRW